MSDIYINNIIENEADRVKFKTLYHVLVHHKRRNNNCETNVNSQRVTTPRTLTNSHIPNHPSQNHDPRYDNASPMTSPTMTPLWSPSMPALMTPAPPPLMSSAVMTPLSSPSQAAQITPSASPSEIHMSSWDGTNGLDDTSQFLFPSLESMLEGDSPNPEASFDSDSQSQDLQIRNLSIGTPSTQSNQNAATTVAVYDLNNYGEYYSQSK